MLARLPQRLGFWHPACLLATWGGSGLLPVAPGTWGSLVALPFAWAIHSAVGPWGLVLAAVLACAAGWWAAKVYIAHAHVADPGPVVIDEVAGQWLTLAVAPLDWRAYVIGFFLFRAADILKPWPASWADRRVGGGLGVMLDDVIAAGYAAAALFLITYYWL